MNSSFGKCLGMFLLLAWLSAFFNTAAWAEEGYVGERECYACHKKQKRSYMEGLHGKVFTGNPRQAGGCEACHGPGAEHLEVMDQDDYNGPAKIDALGKDQAPAAINQRCLTCHQSGERMHWQGGQHAIANLACTSCHTIHGSGPTVTQERCLSCHVERRAQMQRSAHMPLREGAMTCMDCHNPHGGVGPSMLATATVNDSCYECHAEKRGPVLWEHAPVREDCSNCHDPHGTNYPSMLKIALPFLCQNCHAGIFHPSTLYDGSALAAADKHQIGKGCVNCHSQIHGSNHPSGARLQR